MKSFTVAISSLQLLALIVIAFLIWDHQRNTATLADYRKYLDSKNKDERTGFENKVPYVYSKVYGNVDVSGSVSIDNEVEVDVVRGQIDCECR